VVNYKGELIDGIGTIGNTYADHGGVSAGDGVTYQLLSDKDSLRSNRSKGNNFDSYRLYTTFTSPIHRLRSNFGFYYKLTDEDPGSMRAFILSQDKKIDKKEFEGRKKYLREKYKIKVLSIADPRNDGASQVKRLQ